ncbi:MAG: SDR family oxidoreductase [Rhodobacteraceae bacterium]|nr:MAG: SDR family oxidoreductase [Paracoccaceae bacterium]
MAELQTQDLTGQVVLITGASRGIGAEAARAFLAAGAQVGIAARSAEALKTLAKETGALPLTCDVADFNAVAAAVSEMQSRFGRLDVLVNNAGVIEPIAPLAQADPVVFGALIDINLKGVFHGMRAALPVMQAQGAGTIITVGSGAAHNALEGWGAYCASKSGALMLTRVADLEARGRGVRVMSLSPGTVATEMQRTIRDSGINAVSRLDWSSHIPPDWPARALVWMCTPDADDWVGREVSLRDEAIRARLGLRA